ncbi:unnamed protein product [Soboliphyme baturini]|uniref:Phage portal protein n=1 Tax=Soboliphyme baturini TaxID=241478 RepID=A0A183III9_9BILA|nr:unnamed protein product [Soboliphyme baturini]
MKNDYAPAHYVPANAVNLDGQNSQFTDAECFQQGMAFFANAVSASALRNVIRPFTWSEKMHFTRFAVLHTEPLHRAAIRKNAA